MSNKKILKNTMALYTRQVIVILISLYTLRVVINTLGIEDYGIYTVVAGFVALLGFLPGTLASATQRFFSFAMGEGDKLKLYQTFSVNLVLYAVIALIAWTILQTVGLWYIENYLKIPEGRTLAAVSIYKMVTISFVVSIFSSPFIAIIIAHEDMHIFALLSVIDTILKLIAVILLNYVVGDNLVLYGKFLLVNSLVIAVAYILVCFKRYSECQLKKFHWNSKLLKESIGFTGWTLFGQLSTAFRNQAVTILINQAFNPATVAARSIALTVSSQVMVFATNLNTGLYPPIIKSYAAGSKKQMLDLITNGSKLTFFLMWIFALPMILEMETILRLWLKAPPAEATLFARLALVESLILSISLPIATAARAPGKMKLYELSLGTVQILIFFASWLALKAGYSAASVFIIAIIANIIMFQMRLSIVNILIDLPLYPYYKKVLTPVTLIILLSSLPGLLIHNMLPDSIWSSLLTIITCMIGSIITMYYIGLDKVWREKILGFITNRLTKIGAKK